MKNTSLSNAAQFIASSFAAVCMLCSPAVADVVINFSTDNGTSFTNDFDVEVGGSLSVGIYVQQTGGDTVLTDEGLVSWGFDLTSSPDSFGSIASATVNPVFDFSNHDVTTTTGFEWEFFESVGTGIKGNEILLGTMQFDSTGVGMTTFSITDRIPGGGGANANWVTPSLNFLDEQIFGTDAADTIQFTITSSTAVPEPSSLATLSCLGVLVFSRRKRKVCNS